VNKLSGRALRVALALPALFVARAAHADEPPVDDAPWEAEDLRATEVPEPPSMALGPLNELVLGGIRFYQVKIGTSSISRCPYVVSCSAFAKQSFTELGFFGLPAFLDRFFYRENPDTFMKYPRYVMPDGVIRYDDAAFHLD
jgi:hypothetical protein